MLLELSYVLFAVTSVVCDSPNFDKVFNNEELHHVAKRETVVSSGRLNYQMYNQDVTWSEAKDLCISHGGVLTKISDQEIQSNVAEHIQSNVQDRNFWFDASDATEEGLWRDSGGVLLNYTNWNNGEPDDTSSNNNCALLLSSAYSWSDVNCDEKHPFICQFASWNMKFILKDTSRVTVKPDIPDITDVTVAFWMKTNVNNPGCVFSYAIDGYSVTGRTFALCDYTDLQLFIDEWWTSQAGINLNDGEWHFFVATWSNADGGTRLSKDSDLPSVATGLKTNHTIPGGGLFYLGQFQDGYNTGFSTEKAFIGEITYFNVWDKVLTEVEITAMTTEYHGNHIGNIVVWVIGSFSVVADVGIEQSDLAWYKLCSNNPCLNGGNCTVTSDGYECCCQYGYGGEHCEMTVSTTPEPTCTGIAMRSPFDGVKFEFTGKMTSYVKIRGEIPPLHSFTTCVWVKPAAVNHGDVFSYVNEQDEKEFELKDYTGLNFLVRTSNIENIGTINNGVWTHLCVTWTNGGGDCHIFKDGNEIKSKTGIESGTTLGGGGVVHIGLKPDPDSVNVCIGEIADFVMWNRVIEIEEITNLAGRCGGTAAAGVICALPLTLYSVNDVALRREDICGQPSCSSGLDELVFNFDGTDSSYVSIDMEVPELGNMTICQWVRFLTSGPSGLFCYPDVSVNNTKGLCLTVQSGSNGITNLFINGSKTGLTIGNLYDKDWHHICVSWESINGTLIAYDKGTQKRNTKKMAGYTIPAGGKIILGKEYTFNGEFSRFFNGQISGTHFWNNFQGNRAIKHGINCDGSEMGDYFQSHEASGFYGYGIDVTPADRCENMLHSCTSNPCQNGGVCKAWWEAYYCTCQKGWTGIHCEINIDDCAKEPCYNNGTCVDKIAAYKCECMAGFSGQRCGNNINECASSPCINGVCEDQVNGYNCTCTPGYEGILCDTDVNECSSNPCGNGTCQQDVVNEFSCTCHAGYTGTLCLIDINECGSDPCQNNATCNDNVNSYVCDCVPGFQGLNCETDINECEGNPCQNNATCENAINKFICHCLPGFSGDQCEIFVDECESEPCLNNATCNDAINEYSCDCVLGFTGTYCETNIAECASNPCRHGGTCYDRVNSFFCDCIPGYEGIFCETVGDPSVILDYYLSVGVGNILINGDISDGVTLVHDLAFICNTAEYQAATDPGVRMEIREVLVVAMDTMSSSAGSGEDVNGLSGAFNAITKEPSEISSTGQLKAADGMLSLSSTLKSLPNETMSGTLNSATEILSCGSNVLSVSMYDVKPVAKPKRKVSLGDEKSKNSAVTKTIAATLNAASDAVLNKTSNDGEPVSIASDAFDLQLQKSNPADMPSTLGGNGAGSFQLPKGELFGDSTDPVSTQLTSFKGNPLKWAGGSSTITGDVMSLSLKKDDGNELEVSGLNDGVVIVIPNTETDLPDPYFVSVVEENGTEIFSWDLIVADVNTSIRIDIVSLLDDGDQNYTFTIYNVSISHENLTLNITLEPVPISNFTFFVPDEDVTIPGVYVVSINEVGPDFVNFTVEMSTFTCRYMDEENDEWTSKGCKVLPVSDMTAVHCRCTHLSTFGSGFKMIPPNPIDFSTVFAKFKDLDENASVFSTVITMFGLYLVVVIWARHADKKDENEGLMPLVDNNEYDEYLYKVMVHTDVRREAQTKSNVFINVIGDKHRAENRQLKYADMKSFRRGGVVKFVMAVPESLGTIQGIKIWHDNSGKDKSASWCLAKILIEDIQSNKNYFFTCNRWLAVDKDDNKIERFLKASPNEKIGSAKGAFVSKANQDLLDGHIWFSVVGRPASSHFTRVQRASCCLSLIFTSMIANAMWYKTEETNEDDFVIRIGPISISWHQMYVGIMSSMVVFPVNLIIVQLFRKSRPTNVKFDFKRKKKKKKKKVKKNKVKRKLIQNKKSDGIDTLSHMSTIIAGTEPEWDPVGGALHTNKLAEDNANYLRLAGTIKTISSKENQFNFDKALGPSMWSKDDLSLKKKGNGMTIREPPTLAINGNHMEPPSGQDTSAADLRALLESPDSAVSDTSDKKEEKEKKPKEEFWLPHWCLYIAWVLVFLSSVGSAFFTILYSLEWGHEKATEWLISLLVSFLQDVILMQPIKVIILAVVITIIMKQIRKRKGEVDDDDQYLRDTENEDGFNVNNKDLLKAKELREREDTMWSFFREIAVYMFFVIIILSIAYGQRDLTASYMHKSVKDIFVMNSQYSSLSSGFGDFYIWVNEILLPGLYPTEAYNGDDLGNINKDLKMFIDDGYFAYRIGSPRFRQLRVPTDSCSPPPETAFLFSECNGDYNLLTQDETNYGEGWSDDYDPNKTSIGFRDDVWIYHNMTDLEGVPLYGVETLYSGGGYVAVLDTFLWRAKWKVDYLQDTRWLDDRTRAVFVEFTLYNAHVNLFSMFTLLLEYPSTGGALVKTKIDVLRIYNYVGSMTVFVAICEVLFIIMLIYYLIKALIDIKNQKKKYFKQFWNWIEVSKIGLCMAGISMRGYKALFFDIALEELSAEDGATTFINLQQMAVYDETYGYVIAAVVFMGTLQFINLMRFNARMNVLTKTLKGAGRALANYSVIFYIVFFAYGQLLFLTVGKELEQYHTFFGTIKSLYLMFLGSFDYKSLEAADAVIGPFVFFTLTLFVYMILATLFVTVIVWAYEWANEQNSDETNDIVDFMWWKIMSMAGMHERAKQYDPWIEREEEGDQEDEEGEGEKEEEVLIEDEKKEDDAESISPRPVSEMSKRPKPKLRSRRRRRKPQRFVVFKPSKNKSDSQQYGYGNLEALHGRLDYIFDKLNDFNSSRDVKMKNRSLTIAMRQFSNIH